MKTQLLLTAIITIYGSDLMAAKCGPKDPCAIERPDRCGKPPDVPTVNDLIDTSSLSGLNVTDVKTRESKCRTKGIDYDISSIIRFYMLQKSKLDGLLNKSTEISNEISKLRKEIGILKEEKKKATKKKEKKKIQLEIVKHEQSESKKMTQLRADQVQIQFLRELQDSRASVITCCFPSSTPKNLPAES